jgi:hypothetical protein
MTFVVMFLQYIFLEISGQTGVTPTKSLLVYGRLNFITYINDKLAESSVIKKVHGQ